MLRALMGHCSPVIIIITHWFGSPQPLAVNHSILYIFINISNKPLPLSVVQSQQALHNCKAPTVLNENYYYWLVIPVEKLSLASPCRSLGVSLLNFIVILSASTDNNNSAINYVVALVSIEVTAFYYSRPTLLHTSFNHSIILAKDESIK